DDNTAKHIPAKQFPQVIDQDYITNWNNKQAVSFSSAGMGDSSVFRSQLLDEQVKRSLAHGRGKVTLPQLIDDMEVAAREDLRGDMILPLALAVIGQPPADPKLADAIAKLTAWAKDGAPRFDANRDGSYEQADAIQIMDAWWPLWLKVEFEPVLGPALFSSL